MPDRGRERPSNGITEFFMFFTRSLHGTYLDLPSPAQAYFSKVSAVGEALMQAWA